MLKVVILGTALLLSTSALAQSQSPLTPPVPAANQDNVKQTDENQKAGNSASDKKEIPRTANYRGQPGSIVSARRDENSTALIDDYLAENLALENQEELALGRVALEYARRADVKTFARTMIDEHSAAISELRDFLGTGEAQDSAATLGHQLLQIQQDVQRQCLESTKHELEMTTAVEFDHAYLIQQRMAHVKIVGTLAAFERHASPGLKKVIAEQAKIADQHLNHLRQLLEVSGDESIPLSNR